MVASCFVLLFSSFVSKLVRSVASKGRILLLVMLGFQAWDIIFEYIWNDTKRFTVHSFRWWFLFKLESFGASSDVVPKLADIIKLSSLNCCHHYSTLWLHCMLHEGDPQRKSLLHMPAMCRHCGLHVPDAHGWFLRGDAGQPVQLWRWQGPVATYSYGVHSSSTHISTLKDWHFIRRKEGLAVGWISLWSTGNKTWETKNIKELFFGVIYLRDD